MPAVLNNVTTANGFTTLECPRGVRVQITVANATIFYQIGLNVNVHKADPNTIRELLGAEAKPSFSGDVIYGSEVFMLPKSDILSRVCDSIRVRSAVAGKPAQVTITVWKAGEIIGF